MDRESGCAARRVHPPKRNAARNAFDKRKTAKREDGAVARTHAGRPEALRAMDMDAAATVEGRCRSMPYSCAATTHHTGPHRTTPCTTHHAAARLLVKANTNAGPKIRAGHRNRCCRPRVDRQMRGCLDTPNNPAVTVCATHLQHALRVVRRQVAHGVVRVSHALEPGQEGQGRRHRDLQHTRGAPGPAGTQTARPGG